VLPQRLGAMVNHFASFMHRRSFGVPRGFSMVIKPPLEPSESTTPTPLRHEAVEDAYKPSLGTADASSQSQKLEGREHCNGCCYPDFEFTRCRSAMGGTGRARTGKTSRKGARRNRCSERVHLS
jgi:hypothetical protein